MAKIRFHFVKRVCDIQDERETEAANYGEMAKGRVGAAPRGAELLTSNQYYQSFSDHGTVRYYRVRDGAEIRCDDPLVQEC
jgi:hypothetical protein